MKQSRNVTKLLAHACVWLVVVWGVVRSVQNSTNQLQAQQVELDERADRLEQEATELEASAAAGTEAESSSAASQQATLLRHQAAKVRTEARDFWKADWRYLALSGLAYAVGMLFAAGYWLVCLGALGQRVPWRQALWAYFYGGLGKYVPGKAMVIVVRLSVLTAHGVRQVATMLTIFMETLTMMAVGGAVAAGSLILLNLDWRFSLLAAGLLLSMLLPTSPPLLRYLLKRFQPGVAQETLEQWSSRLNIGLMFYGWLILGFAWLAFGLSLGCVLQGLPSTQVAGVGQVQFWLSVYGACALAVVLGFVSLVPGGAGVREVILSMVLAPVVGPTAALCCAVWLRVVWLITELVMVGVCYFLRLPAQVQLAKSP
ncbi:MAG: flippase-like domain-containing protein [Pirellulaceae bacterium]|nr:flippase-like domain-containing protein [Pirellulaceae bacterium]